MTGKKVVAIAVVVYAVYLVVYISQEGWVLMPKPTHWWWWGIAGIMLGINIGYQFSEWENRSVQRKHDRLRELEAENREMFLALRQVLIDTVKLEHDILRDIVGAKSPEVAALLVSCLEKKKKTEKA